jgi:hypothetical protein
MLFEMLSGYRPADGDDAEIIVAAVEAGRVRKLQELVPELPPALIALVERATLPDREQRFDSASSMRLALGQLAGQLSHAGRLAAMAEPLAPLPTPASAALLSLPAPPPSGVPKTIPPDAPPLSVSQLGAARTSLSERPPVAARSTELGGDAPAYAAPAPYGGYAPAPYGVPLPVTQSVPPPKRRSGLLLFSLVVIVLGAGGAVGYAAYRAADQHRVIVPPLPDAGTLPTSEPTVKALTPDNQFPSSAGRGPDSTPGKTPTTSTTVSKPPVTGPGGGVGSATGGTSGSGPVVISGGGGGTTIQLPFPLPSGIQIPTALPSGIQLPPGISFPPGFPGVPQPAPGVPTSSPAPTGAPTATTAPTSKPPRRTTPPSAN